MIANNCDWIFAEICRVFANLPIDEAQKVIENIIKIELPIIEKIEDVRRVLDTTLNYEKKVLVLLLGEYPSFVKVVDLFKWTEHSKKSVFFDLLKNMHKKRLIELREDDAKLLIPGIKEAEIITTIK